MKKISLLQKMLGFTFMIGMACIHFAFINAPTPEKAPQALAITVEEDGTVTIEIQNYSDWYVRVREIKKDGRKGNFSPVCKPKKGNCKLRFDNIKGIVIQWKDGLNWKKYAQYGISGNSCFTAKGKVMQMKGVTIKKCK